jgi:hypothetical protein
MDRILATRPAFIVVDDDWAPPGDLQALDIPERDVGRVPPEPPAAVPILARLHAALAQDYVPDGTPAEFRSRGGARLGARAGVIVYRRRDVAAWVPTQRLGYRPAPKATTP